MAYSKDELLELGIKKLKNFGFLNVNRKNVLEDAVYAYHFKKFMSFLLGQSEDLDLAIKELLTSIDKKNETH
ncbi:MAG: hypothetical protein V4506_08200 [Bacteroidota bacterium]